MIYSVLFRWKCSTLPAIAWLASRDENQQNLGHHMFKQTESSSAERQEQPGNVQVHERMARNFWSSWNFLTNQISLMIIDEICLTWSSWNYCSFSPQQRSSQRRCFRTTRGGERWSWNTAELGISESAPPWVWMLLVTWCLLDPIGSWVINISMNQWTRCAGVVHLGWSCLCWR